MKYLLEPGVRHIMIDIETLDVTPDAPIISVAAMPFWLTAEEELDFMSSETGELMGDILEFKKFVKLPDPVPNNDTFQWHLKTGTGAIENSVKYGEHLDHVLDELDDWVGLWVEWKNDYPDSKNEDFFIWGWGYGFDMTILASAYRKAGWRHRKMDTGERVLIPKWLRTYWRTIDARSVYFGHGGIWEEYRDGRQGQHHDPLDDVRHQIKTLQRVFRMES